MLEILAQANGGRSGGSALTLLIFAVPLLMFFFLQRSNKRRVQQQRMVQQSVEEGEEILTTGGMFGTVIEADEDEDSILVEIAPGTRVRMTRGAVARRLSEDLYEEDEEEEPAPTDDEGPISSS
jgi:preprotein translocase subunit YajC